MSELFGRYQILDRIAVGGMAEVLLARSVSLGGVARTCVIKRILPQYSHDVVFVSMFIDEARITIALDHPNIVKLYDFGQHEGTYYMAIEYVDGTDLSTLVRTHTAAGRLLPHTLSAYVVRDVLLGLHHAHTLKDRDGVPLGVVHRDVSPQNVLLSMTGDVKLTDFGIAAAKHKLTQTSVGTVLGKAAYMSPEQAKGRPVDFRTDVWATGVILHELLSGERLFADETPLATVQRVVNDPITPPSRRQRNVPTELDDIVMRALERDRDRRYASAAEMADALTVFLQKNRVDGRVHGKLDLARHLSQLDWSDDTAQMRPPQSRASTMKDSTLRHHGLGDDFRIEALVQELRREPNVWGLVSLGERYDELGQIDQAVAAFRTAAAVFAHRGLLVQALCAYHGARTHLKPRVVESDLTAIADLAAGNRKELLDLVQRFAGTAFWNLLTEADPDGLGSDADAQPFPAMPTPLFGYLGPVELARLGAMLRVHEVKPGDVIIREGEAGDALYAVGRGRFVVYCRPGDDGDDAAPAAESVQHGKQLAKEQLEEFADPTAAEVREGLQKHRHAQARDRVYLAGLADGDFFGEFSFLAERPRSATVEAITDGMLLEVDRRAVDMIARADPSYTQPLLQFYKERVVELMMAKSPVFSLLEPHDRRALLEGATLVDFADGQIVVEEGTLNDALYFIKRGEVEVFRKDADETTIFINKLGQGQFFGEIAAVTGKPRTVSVRAMGEASLFQISRASLTSILQREPRLKRLFDDMIKSRTAEMRDRVREHQRLFVAT